MVELLEARLMADVFPGQNPCADQKPRKYFKEKIGNQCFGSITMKDIMDFSWLQGQMMTKISDSPQQSWHGSEIVLGDIVVRISQVVNHS